MGAEQKPVISRGMGFRIFQILLTGLNESRFKVLGGRFGFILRNLSRIILLQQTGYSISYEDLFEPMFSPNRLLYRKDSGQKYEYQKPAVSLNNLHAVTPQNETGKKSFRKPG